MNTLKRRLHALEMFKRVAAGPELVLILESAGMGNASGLLVFHDGRELRIDRTDGESLQDLTARAKGQGAGLTLVQFLPTVAV